MSNAKYQVICDDLPDTCKATIKKTEEIAAELSASVVHKNYNASELLLGIALFTVWIMESCCKDGDLTAAWEILEGQKSAVLSELSVRGWE